MDFTFGGVWSPDQMNQYLTANGGSPMAAPTKIGTGSQIEQESGIAMPTYGGFLNPDGTVNSSYAVDPTKSSAFNQEAQIAQSTDLSPWAKLQMQSNALNTANQRDQSNAQSLGATNQAQQQLMATGGGSNSGASAFLAMQGARNATMANQNIGNQSALNSLNIGATDAQNKQQLLGQVATAETAAQAANAQTAQNSTLGQNAFNANAYNQQMQAWAAQQTANAQTSAANNSGKK